MPIAKVHKPLAYYGRPLQNADALRAVSHLYSNIIDSFERASHRGSAENITLYQLADAEADGLFGRQLELDAPDPIMCLATVSECKTLVEECLATCTVPCTNPIKKRHGAELSNLLTKALKVRPWL